MKDYISCVTEAITTEGTVSLTKSGKVLKSILRPGAEASCTGSEDTQRKFVQFTDKISVHYLQDDPHESTADPPSLSEVVEAKRGSICCTLF